jgi:uncharacterized OB-fold protein
VSGLSVWRCERCRRVVFPRRELCPHCCCDSFVDDSVDEGTATEVTSHRGTRIGCVEVEGTRLLVRAGEGVRPGSRVALGAEDGAPVALMR